MVFVLSIRSCFQFVSGFGHGSTLLPTCGLLPCIETMVVVEVVELGLAALAPHFGQNLFWWLNENLHSGLAQVLGMSFAPHSAQ